MQGKGDVVAAFVSNAESNKHALGTSASTTFCSSKSSCSVSSTSHIAARRCSVKQLSAPNSAKVRNSSFESRTRRLKSSNESNCRFCPCLTSSSACSWRNPLTTQDPGPRGLDEHPTGGAGGGG